MTKIQKLLEYSFKHKLAHIPSALSMYNYLECLFEHYIDKEDIIILGKPFGAQAYYLIWKEMGWLDDIDNLSVGVKHEEIDFIDYSEETIGNALGVAIGMAIAQPQKQVFVNITDATLQMGNTLEAIQFIGHHNIHNILVTIDYNGNQVTGSTDEIIGVDGVESLFRDYKWNVYHSIDGNDFEDCCNTLQKWDTEYHYEKKFLRPSVIYFHTTKGYGVPYMKKNPKEWHYKKLSEEHMI